jgi:triosephosphate isomerase
MRRKVVAGNWKMNMSHRTGASLAGSILEAIRGKRLECDIMLFPPFISIISVVEVVGESEISIGGQDLYFEDGGAFTGEVSGEMLRTAGCSYVLVGHSERRHIMGEGGEILSKKLRAALRNDLNPVYCVGETMKERERGDADEVVTKQMSEVLEDLETDEIVKVTIAYEPVWAIGTGKTATPEDADEMHGLIRKKLEDMAGVDTAENTKILYGGSVKPHNASEIMKQSNVDGVLVGGASLEAGKFAEIIFSA